MNPPVRYALPPVSIDDPKLIFNDPRSGDQREIDQEHAAIAVKANEGCERSFLVMTLARALDPEQMALHDRRRAQAEAERTSELKDHPLSRRLAKTWDYIACQAAREPMQRAHALVRMIEENKTPTPTERHGA